MRGFVKGYTSTEIFLVVRQYSLCCTPFDENHHASKKLYANIMKKIHSYHKEWITGKLTKLLELDGSNKMKLLREKLVHLGSRRRKPVSEVDRVEVYLLDYLEDCWVKKRRVTRNIIFWNVVELDTNFLGGVGFDNHMSKLNKWFITYLSENQRFTLGI